MTTDPFQQHREDFTDRVLAAVCGLSILGTLLNTLGRPLVIGLGCVAVAAFISAARWVARWLRERREDAADALTGAEWRAQHMPDLAAQIDVNRALDRVWVA
jgi:hypothetical protein